MSAGWKIFRVFCVLYLIYWCFSGLIALLSMPLSLTLAGLITIMLAVLIIRLSVLALQLLNNNFPDKPVIGSQRKTFNRLYLLNFLSLAFLFGVIFSNINTLRATAALLKKPVTEMESGLYWPLALSLLILLGQFSLLFGLFKLRRLLAENAASKKFEFEE